MAAKKLARCLELVSEDVVNISNLTVVSSDSENKMRAFASAVSQLETLGTSVVLNYEGPLHLESSVLKQVVLLVTGEPDPTEGFSWTGKER